MNSLTVAILAIVLFGVGYKVYGNILSRLFGVDASMQTPAHTKYDGVDYVPAKHWVVLFGHHFSSIAGAGPIIGPILAVSIWGWGPALAWIVLGTLFVGGVHDFGTLMASVRHGGCSIAEVAEKVISRRARVLFSLFVWLALVLVIAVFIVYCTKTFVAEPKIILPSLGIIPVAILVGIMLYRLKGNLILWTVVGLSMVAGFLFLGSRVPIQLGGNAFIIWACVLLAYCYIASVTPVQILLQPRDYLSAYLLVFGVGMGYLGLIITRPVLNGSAYVAWNASQGALWPMLFVTVACGAISGFHSLIASGTTSKQLSTEKDARRISYGGMVTEGAVAVLALIAVTCLPAASAAQAGGRQADLSSILSSAGPIAAFGIGYGEISKPILGTFGAFIAITILNAFILTTLDTATRIARYLTQELFGIKNRYLSTLIIVALAGWLALSGEGDRIWPVFGASNQLVAALALLVLTSWLLSKGKPALYTAIPCGFMLVTTVGALVFQIMRFVSVKNYLLSGISSLLIVLAFYLLYEVTCVLRRAQKG